MSPHDRPDAPVTAYIGLGGNLDHPLERLTRAFDELGHLPETRLLARSRLYRTAPVGYADQPDFINGVAQVCTALSPHELLAGLLALERRHGRRREFPNAPRTLDLDILLFGSLQFADDSLEIPHPRMGQRAFVLLPLLELSPAVEIPGQGAAATLMLACADQRVSPVDRTPGP